MINIGKEKIINFCKTRNGFVRIPFLIGFLYVFVRHLHDPMYRSIFGGLNLGIHEFGHLIFSPFGEFINILGGTIVQLLVPVYGVYNFIKQNDFFSAVLCFGWLSTNYYDVATYSADARSMSLPLVSPFGSSVYHDWNYILTRLNILQWDAHIGFLFRVCGFLTMSFCLLAGSWLIFKMIQLKKEPNVI
jgi:hypothetical protein